MLVRQTRAVCPFYCQPEKLIGGAALVVVDPWSILATLTRRRCVAATAERHCDLWVRPETYLFFIALVNLTDVSHFSQPVPNKVKMSEVQSYVSAKYVAANLLTKDGLSTTPEGDYDPWIYPATGHIPFCTQCQSDFDSFKKQPLNKASITAEMEHSNACLWYDYFCKKMRLMAPNVVIRRTVKSAAPVTVKK